MADRIGAGRRASFPVLGNVIGLTTDFRAIIPAMQTRTTIMIAGLVLGLMLLRIWRIQDERQRTTHMVSTPG